jgi:hypothetical protein
MDFTECINRDKGLCYVDHINQMITLSVITLSVITLSVITLSVITLSVITLSVITLSSYKCITL